MAQTEDIVILNVQTGEAVQNMADLRSNVSILKKELDNLEIGSEEYQNTLSELKLNQNALKDAMYATSSSMADVSQSAAGMNESYNSLVHRMAALKEEFRSTTDVMRRAEIGQQIKSINDELKSLDALQGNFQRNVGDYTNSIKMAFEGADLSGSALGKTIKNVDTATRLMSQNPLFGIITLLLPVIAKLSSSLKENESVIEATDKAMNALKPVTDFFSRIIQKIADLLSDVITKVASFVTSNGIFQQVINGLIGVGNAIIQYVAAPFKGVIEAIKVFKEQGIKGIKDAARAFGQEMKSGFSFKQNFQTGQSIGDALIGGMASKKDEVKDAVASGIKEGVKEGVEEGIKLVDWEKALAEGERKAEEARRLRLQQQKEIDDAVKADIDATNSEIEDLFNQLEQKRKQEKDNEEREIEERKIMMQDLYESTQGILSALADLYEANSENNEKAAKKAKNIRIASATIDTISGAIAAFMSVWKGDWGTWMTGPLKFAYAASMSASVLAAGMENIAKMKATNVSSSGGAATIGASVSAPAIGMGIPQTSIINSNAQDARFDRMAQDQRVYILQSDIEAKGRASKARIRESSF